MTSHDTGASFSAGMTITCIDYNDQISTEPRKAGVTDDPTWTANPWLNDTYLGKRFIISQF